MAKTMGGIPTDCEGNTVGNGRPVTGKAPKKAQAGDFDIARTDTVGKRIARALWH